MDLVTKDFAVLNDPSDNSPTGGFEVILSAPTLDRDDEVIDAKAFEPLPEHITFDTDHSMTCDSVVGSGVPSYAPDGTLRVKGTYCSDERSQTIRQKVADGHIRTTSVTFMAADRTPDEKGIVHVKRAELLNGTFTPVPSNREAIVITAKSIVAKAGARNSGSDSERLQTIHDMAVANGATCEAKHFSGDAIATRLLTPAEVRDIETAEIDEKDTTPQTPADTGEETETSSIDSTADAAAVAAKAATETADAADEGKARLALTQHLWDGLAPL